MNISAETGAIIVAAGKGRRVGGPLPKQWRDLAGRTVLARALDAFLEHPEIGPIALVLAAEDMAMAPGYEGHGGLTVVEGGASRAESVRAGLLALEGHALRDVLIHDAARPLVSAALISRVIAALREHEGAAPAVPLADALWRGENGMVQEIVPRAGLYRAQTPQGFRFTPILAAHGAFRGDPSDDVEVARAAGIEVAIVPGEERNLKITTEEDFARARMFLAADGKGDAQMDIRIGNGFDVHAFAEGDSLTLCGVRIPHDRALSGHSDADVGMHALTDAIYGALADGDIGRHFPPSDPQWKGADSAILLEHACSRMRARGYALANADITLICEAPKIGPHADAMAARLAGIMDLPPGKISVKATTTEKLGFAGRNEGIAALAVVQLVRP